MKRAQTTFIQLQLTTKSLPSQGLLGANEVLGMGRFAGFAIEFHDRTTHGLMRYLESASISDIQNLPWFREMAPVIQILAF